MRPDLHKGALGACLALLLAGPAAALALSPQEAGAGRKEPPAAEKPDGDQAKDAAKKDGTTEKAQPKAGSGKARAEGKRLRPGFRRMKTDVDLSKIDGGPGHNVEPEAGQDGASPAVVRPSELERQSPRAGGAAPERGAEAVLPTTIPVAPQEQDGTADGPPGHVTVQGEDRHDFGQLIQGAHASHVFRLVSDGENDLVISRIKPSCGCTVANVNLIGADGAAAPYATGSPIPPGTEFEIEAAFKSDGKQGHTKTQVAVYCNDPRTVVSLMLEAEVLPVLVLEPRTLNLGTTTSAQPVEGTMRLSSPTLPAFQVTVDEQFLQPQMDVRLRPIDPDPDGRAKEWEVKVVLGPELPEGMRNYPVRLTTDQAIPSPRDEHEHAPTNYFVIGYAQVQVEGLVSANPAYVPFGMVRPGEAVERVVRIDCRDDFPLSADAPLQMTALIQNDVFDYGEAFATELARVEGENALDLTIRLLGLPEEASGSFGGMIKVGVGHPGKQELLVRFSGVCRPAMPEPSQRDQ